MFFKKIRPVDHTAGRYMDILEYILRCILKKRRLRNTYINLLKRCKGTTSISLTTVGGMPFRDLFAYFSYPECSVLQFVCKEWFNAVVSSDLLLINSRDFTGKERGLWAGMLRWISIAHPFANVSSTTNRKSYIKMLVEMHRNNMLGSMEDYLNCAIDHNTKCRLQVFSLVSPISRSGLNANARAFYKYKQKKGTRRTLAIEDARMGINRALEHFSFHIYGRRKNWYCYILEILYTVISHLWVENPDSMDDIWANTRRTYAKDLTRIVISTMLTSSLYAKADHQIAYSKIVPEHPVSPKDMEWSKFHTLRVWKQLCKQTLGLIRFPQVVSDIDRIVTAALSSKKNKKHPIIRRDLTRHVSIIASLDSRLERRIETN